MNKPAKRTFLFTCDVLATPRMEKPTRETYEKLSLQATLIYQAAAHLLIY